MRQTVLIILALAFWTSCSDDFSGGNKFGIGGNGGKKPQEPQTGNSTQIQRTDGGDDVTTFHSGNNYLPGADGELFYGSGKRDCSTDPYVDESATFNFPGNGAIIQMINDKCLTAMPGGSAMYNNENEREFLCQLAGYVRATSWVNEDWSSPGDNFTNQFIKTGEDPVTGLITGHIQITPASSIANSWLRGLTCEGQLHNDCQFKTNDAGKIDCTGL